MSEAVQEKPKKLCSVKDILPENMLRLLAMSPKHPTLRTVVQTRIKQPIPEDCKGYKAIVDWIEAHINPADLGVKAKPDGDSFRSFAITGIRQVSGRASFYGRETAQIDYCISSVHLLELAAQSQHIDQLRRRVSDEINRNWQDADGGDGWEIDYDSVEYEEHETNDTDGDQECDFGQSRLDQWIRNWLGELSAGELRRLIEGQGREQEP